jgi:formate dehydrogenase major subunit
VADDGFGYDYLVRLDSDGDYSGLSLLDGVSQGRVNGLMVWGQNPAVGSAGADAVSRGLERLDWLVVTDLFETETAAFWKRPGINPSGIQTEVFLLPAAASFEKSGSVTNSGRWMQWREKALDPLGESRADLGIVDGIMKRLKDLYAEEGGPNEKAISNLTWSYGDALSVAREINGYRVGTGLRLEAADDLTEDGDTVCGNRLYRGSMAGSGNMAARRDIDPGGFIINLYHRWGWSWPGNTRILHNRASVDLDGKPWDGRRSVIEWDSFNKRWKGDVPDGTGGPHAQAFVNLEYGCGRMFTAGLPDGPLPEHYEPWESPVQNMLSSIQNTPLLRQFEPLRANAAEYPLVAFTFRVGEHFGSGQMTRNMPWLLEMSPEPFIEISYELAGQRGIRNGDEVIVRSVRGEIRMRALLTHRLKPLDIGGQTIHQVALPTQWGFIGLGTGDSANRLIPAVGDAMSAVPEFKAFLCDIVKGA